MEAHAHITIMTSNGRITKMVKQKKQKQKASHIWHVGRLSLAHGPAMRQTGLFCHHDGALGSRQVLQIKRTRSP